MALNILAVPGARLTAGWGQFMNQLQEWWLLRPKHWYLVPLPLLLALVLWYLIAVRLPREAQWDECEFAYARATTAADSAKVDLMRPTAIPPSGVIHPEPCGFLRNWRKRR